MFNGFIAACVCLYYQMRFGGVYPAVEGNGVCYFRSKRTSEVVGIQRADGSFDKSFPYRG